MIQTILSLLSVIVPPKNRQWRRMIAHREPDKIARKNYKKIGLWERVSLSWRIEMGINFDRFREACTRWAAELHPYDQVNTGNWSPR